MNSTNKCPYSEGNSAKTEPSTTASFTYKFARRALGLTSNKAKFEQEYGNLSLEEMRKISQNQDSEKIENLSRSIDREISIYIFKKLLPEIEHIEILPYNPKIHKDELEYLNEVTVNHISISLTAIVYSILRKLYTEIKEKNNQRIHNIMKVQNEIHKTNQITENLENQIIRDGIFMTVKQLLSKIATLTGALGGSFDRNGFEVLLEKDEKTWNERALSSLSLQYIASYLGEGSFQDNTNNIQKKHRDGFGADKYNPEHETIIPDLTQEEFLLLVEAVKKQNKFHGEIKVYEGCPLLYTNQDTNRGKTNGIIAYQRSLYKIMLDHFENCFNHESTF